MTNFGIYRFLAPFRSRLQRRIRDDRLNVDLNLFTSRLGARPDNEEMARLLWDILRQQAFVEDFRPDPRDSLERIFAMGPEEVRDDLIVPIADQLGIDFEKINLRNFNFLKLDTPKAVAEFITAAQSAMPD